MDDVASRRYVLHKPTLVVEPYRPPVRFPMQLRELNDVDQDKKFLSNFKKLHFNIPFVEALKKRPKYAKHL